MDKTKGDTKKEPNERLKYEREWRGWTQKELVDRLLAMCEDEDDFPLISDDTVSRWERGVYNPQFFWQRKLCELFGKNAEELGFIKRPAVPGPSFVSAPPLSSSQTLLPASSIRSDALLARERREASTFGDEGNDSGAYSPHVAPFQTWGERNTARASSGMLRGMPGVFIPLHEAVDILFEKSDARSEQRVEAWQALLAGDFALLFDLGWSIDQVLDAQRIILEGVQAMPEGIRNMISRRAVIERFLKLAAIAAVGNIPIPSSEKHVSAEERSKLHCALGENIAAGWRLFHTAGNAQVLAVAQAQFSLVQQVSPYLYPSVLPLFYTGVQRLIGAALFFQGKYSEANRAQESAYMAALEIADVWNMAQCRTWQIYGYQARGQHREAIQAIEGALRLTMGQHDEATRRLRSHLLACWAENASPVHGHRVAQEKLEASFALLEGIGPNEEFDRMHWSQIAGNCALKEKKYGVAIRHYKKALTELPASWIMRYAVTAMPLATAYARTGERDLSLTVAKNIVSMIKELNAPIMHEQLTTYIRHDLLELFPGDSCVHAFIGDMRGQLPQVASVIG